MLQEFPRVRQEAAGYRRLFQNARYSLYVWYESKSSLAVEGFQLTYMEDDDMKAYTWLKQSGSSHMAVDGWDSHRFNKTPVLIADGKPNLAFLLSEMRQELAALESSIRDLVIGVLEAEALKPQP